MSNEVGRAPQQKVIFALPTLITGREQRSSVGGATDRVRSRATTELKQVGEKSIDQVQRPRRSFTQLVKNLVTSESDHLPTSPSKVFKAIKGSIIGIFTKLPPKQLLSDSAHLVDKMKVENDPSKKASLAKDLQDYAEYIGKTGNQELNSEFEEIAKEPLEKGEIKGGTIFLDMSAYAKTHQYKELK